METQPPAVATDKLRKVYRAGSNPSSVVAIECLDLRISCGETFGLIGPNGAGKTTLLRILATLLPPSLGAVRVAGFDCEREREQVCARVGFMPELFALYEQLRVWEYLDFFAGAYGVPPREREKTIDDVIELTDLGVRRDALTGSLSKGMRQRLLLAKTLIHDPEVLLLDEPTSGMDPQARIEFRNVIRTLAKMNKTIVISSHILSDLSSYCNSVGIMECGRLRISGSIEEVLAALEMKPEVEVGFVPGAHDPVAVVRPLPGVSAPRISGGRLLFGFEGSDEQKAAVLHALVAAGIRVTEFVERRKDLEDIFLQVGATRVQ